MSECSWANTVLWFEVGIACIDCFEVIGRVEQIGLEVLSRLGS